MAGELDLLAHLKKRFALAGQRFLRVGDLGIGDDAAVLSQEPGETTVWAADAVVAGVHADLSLTSPRDLGWKAMAANLSDVAAMGCKPRSALLSLAAPDEDLAMEVIEGVAEAAEEYGCPVVGGDLTTSATLVVSVAVAGWTRGAPVLRSGARPGDEVWVSGSLGSSAAGLRLLRSGRGKEWPALVAAHARPRPRMAEGVTAAALGATAMADVSDGLLSDLRNICRASGVGVNIDQVPVAEGATLDEALNGGEDYQLLFCCPEGTQVASEFGKFITDSGGVAPHRIGTCILQPNIFWNGALMIPEGWQHRW